MSAGPRGRHARTPPRLSLDARAGADGEVLADVGGHYQAPFKGLDLRVNVSGSARLDGKAEADAEVATTRRPPKALAKGSTGDSAVAKAAGDVRAHAAPFAVPGETRIPGYDRSKLDVGGDLRAALGLASASAPTAGVDLAAIGSAAAKKLTAGWQAVAHWY